MKTNAIVRIILFSIAILVLLGILLGVFAFNFFLIDTKTQSSRVDHVEAVIEQIDTNNISADIRNIEIDWVAGSITFQVDQHATAISVHEFSPAESKYKMVLTQSDQTLKILYCDDDSIKFPFGTDIDISKDLVITVPMNWNCNCLEIDTAAAEVALNDLSIQEFDFDGASGVCKIRNCDIDKVDIETASGDVHFSGTLETLDCDAVSADCNIEVFNIPRSIKLDGLSGDLELILPPNAGFTCNLDTMSGSFDTAFEFDVHNDTYICGDGSCKIKVSAMSGDVNILKGITALYPEDFNYCSDPDCSDPSHNHTYICTTENCTETIHAHNRHHQ